MHRFSRRTWPLFVALGTFGLAGLLGAPQAEAAKAANPCAANPCAPRNPCAPKAKNPCAPQNPCAPKAKNPCAPQNPCGAAAPDLDPSRIRQPRNAKIAKSTAARVAAGAKLFRDPALGTSGLSCATCHYDTGRGPYGAINATFAKPYPHFVQMAKDRAGLEQVNAAEMVQLCMVVPMQAEPLAWDSEELANLTAYVESVRPGFKPAAAKPANPCAAAPRNPCAAKPMNPCGR